MFVVGDDVPKWLPKWASQLKTIMSDLRLRNGNFPFQNRKGCELGLYNTIWRQGLFYKFLYDYGISCEFVNIIRSMYRKLSGTFRTDEGCGESFHIENITNGLNSLITQN